MRFFRRGVEGYDFISVGKVPGMGLFRMLRRARKTRKKVPRPRRITW